MASEAFEKIVQDFEFIDEWEERYRYVIEQGKAMTPLVDAMKVPATKVSGCASQVWIYHQVENGQFFFRGESDAMIVNGLIAVLRKLYNGLSIDDVLSVEARSEMARLGLNDHLSMQRSNGLNAMIARIRSIAQSHE